jgi:hypothetical protein
VVTWHLSITVEAGPSAKLEDLEFLINIRSFVATPASTHRPKDLEMIRQRGFASGHVTPANRLLRPAPYRRCIPYRYHDPFAKLETLKFLKKIHSSATTAAPFRTDTIEAISNRNTFRPLKRPRSRSPSKSPMGSCHEYAGDLDMPIMNSNRGDNSWWRVGSHVSGAIFRRCV